MTELPSIFAACTPRQDILDGNFESGLAADLARVANDEADPEYGDPEKFFARTYPTNGIRKLLRQVLERLGGRTPSAVFWLDTSFGGGKTHALITLLHAARSPAPDIMSGFVDPSLLPAERVKIAVFDGENADPSSGHDIGEGIRAHTPWGEIAYRLGGKAGYRRVADSISDAAPGADTIRDLLGDGPALILLDELAIYLRKASRYDGAESQFTAFLTTLIKAVEGTRNTALIFTVAMSSEENRSGTDAYFNEHNRLDELKSVASRKATILNPTEEGETIQVLKRRLFARCDDGAARAVAAAYRNMWGLNRDKLPVPSTADDFAASYPLHPEVLNTLVSKTSTLENFQRIRGMLRLLGHAVHYLWRQQGDAPSPAAIHLHHIDLGKERIRGEITTKAVQDSLVPAIDNDVACDTENKTSLAQRLDQKHYPNMAPFTTYVARTILMHSLAFSKQLKGTSMKNLRYSILSPNMEISYIDEALNRFKEESLYLDDDPEKPISFQAHPNLNEVIRRTEQSVENGLIVGEIDRRMREMFTGNVFDLRLFPRGHEDVDDGADSPKLVVPEYTDVSTSNPESPPSMITDIFEHKGIGGLRENRNNLVFLVAHDARIEPMRAAARAYLARESLSEPGPSSDLAEHQKAEIKRQRKRTNEELYGAILQCYKYVHYPRGVDKLPHEVMTWRRGDDVQKQVAERLRDIRKLRRHDDEPDSTDSIVERIPELGIKGMLSVKKFRGEFFRNPDLPMLIGDVVFIKGVEHGIEDGTFVYEKGDMMRGQGDAASTISISDDSTIYLTRKAKQLGKWPRKTTPPTQPKSGGAKPKPARREPDLTDFEVTDKPYDAINKTLLRIRELGVEKITRVQIASSNDIFPLLVAINRIKDIETHAKLVGDYKTGTGGTFLFEYEGRLADVDSERDFLKNRLQNTDSANIRTDLTIDLGLGVQADWLETLASELKFVDNSITIFKIVGEVNDDRS